MPTANGTQRTLCTILTSNSKGCDPPFIYCSPVCQYALGEVVNLLTLLQPHVEEYTEVSQTV